MSLYLCKLKLKHFMKHVTVSPRINVHALIFEDALIFRKQVHALIFEHKIFKVKDMHLYSNMKLP